MDLTSATDSLLGAVLVFVIFCTKEKGYPLETSTDDRCFCREPDGRLPTSVYRKPTHTDQHSTYDSHHPQLVKRGIAKCPYDRAKRLVAKPSFISEEKKHLSVQDSLRVR